MLFRRDFSDLPEEQQEHINVINETFQNAVQSVRITSCADGSEFHIKCVNVEVPGSDKLLWTAMRYLIGSDSTAAMEIHNFDAAGNTIDIEKYVVTNVCIEIIRDHSTADPQEVDITGVINSEIL
jgi:hypothetical protein